MPFFYGRGLFQVTIALDAKSAVVQQLKFSDKLRSAAIATADQHSGWGSDRRSSGARPHRRRSGPFPQPVLRCPNAALRRQQEPLRGPEGNESDH